MNDKKKPGLLLCAELPEHIIADLADSFTIHRALEPEPIDKAVRAHKESIKAVVTIGRVGVRADHIDLLRNLEIVLFKGAGHEAIDLELARARGITVATGSGTNAKTVAEHAMALLLSLTRDIVVRDRRTREGLGPKSRSARPLIAEKRLGIIGLGNIGRYVARRGQGFDMTIAYHSPRQKDDVPYAYKATPLDLARESDILILSCPGGPATEGIVDAAVLEALGPKGFLVNVARGSVVDTQALVDALHQGRIAGAALDVWDERVGLIAPPELLEAPNLILTPHTGARSPETTEAASEIIQRNLKMHLKGRPVAGRVA